MGKKMHIRKRLTALVLAVALLMTSAYNQPMFAKADDYIWGQDVELSGFSHALHVYNVYFRTSGTGQLEAISDSLSLKSPVDTSFNQNVIIGDHADTTADTAPRNLDIPVRLNGVSMEAGKTMYINPVYGGVNKVLMFVSETSVLSGLQVEAGGILELTLDAALTINTLTMSGNSQLIIHTNGHTCTIGSITDTDPSGVSSIIIDGNGSVSVSGKAAVDTLLVDKATVNVTDVNVTGALSLRNSAVLDGSKGSIIAGGDITVDDATVQNVSALGYDGSAVGLKNISLTKANLTNVDLIGAKEECVYATVIINRDGQGNISNEKQATSFVSDYKLTYKYNDIELTQSQWPAYYRVLTAVTAGNSEHTIQGTITQTDAVYTYTALPAEAKGVLTLPVYTQEGYGYEGWKKEGEDTAITTLQAEAGNQVLIAQMTPGAVVIDWELNYTPGDFTNPEDILSTLPKAAYIGETISLVKPYTFGCTFAGWKITTGETRVLSSSDTEYEIKLSDLTKDDNGTYQLKMEALWTPDTFDIVLNLETDDVDINNIRFKADDEELTIQGYVAGKSGILFDPNTKSLSFTDGIEYGETLGAYFSRIGFDYLALIDANTNLAEKKRFVTWTYSGATIKANTVFALGEDGLLDLPTGKSLEQYHDQLRAEKSVFRSLWNTAEYRFYFDEVPGWTFWVDGKQLTSTQEGTVITAGTTISIKHAAGQDPTLVHLSKWKIGYTDFRDLYNEIPKQSSYKDGDSEVTFTFEMPTYDIAAAYCGERKSGETYTAYGYNIMTDSWNFPLPPISNVGTIYVDLSKGNITFAENITHEGIKNRTGFYHDAIIDAMTPLFEETVDGKVRYFYCWEFNEPFYVTTSDPTQNQLTIINAMKVYLKNVEMVAREEYSANAVGRKLGTVVMEKQGQGNMKDTAAGAWRSYGNIVLDNSAHKVYQTQLYFEGENNTVASIFQSQYRMTKDEKASLTIGGEKLNLGSVWGNLDVTFSGLELLGQYDNTKYKEYPDNSEYLVWITCNASTNGSVYFKNLTLNAPDKRVFSGFAYIDFVASQVELGSTRHSYNTRVSGKSYIHLLKECYGNYYGFNVSDSASVIFEDSYFTNGYESNGWSISTSGAVIVKGSFMDAGALTLSKGTLIANAVGIGASCKISGGKLVTNQILNMVRTRPSIDSNGEYYFGTTVSTNLQTANKNGDDKPFVTYSNVNSNPTTYAFSGGKVYLLGHYQVEDGKYDLDVTTTTEGNPMAQIIAMVSPVNEGDRYSVSSLTDEVLLNAVSDASQSNKNNQCIIIGNSTYSVGGSKARRVVFSGTKLYAAGHVSLYNETEISGGILECAGNLSSKHDLTITNGTVTAAQIGNAYNLIDVTADQLTRWKQTVISGGTVTADRIGALSSIEDTSVVPRSTVVLNTKVSPRTSNTPVGVVHDVHINYIYNKESNAFLIPEGNPDSFRFTGELNGGASLDSVTNRQLVQDDLTPYAAGGIALMQPTLNDAERTPAQWVIASAPGVAGLGWIASDTSAYTYDTDEISIPDYDVFDREVLPLYLIKNSYTLTVHDKLNALNTINGVAIPDTKQISCAPGGEVTLELKNGDAAKSMVVWYHDDNGILHNAMPQVSGNSVTFSMPVADTEVWITDELTLYLDKYHITFTETGFITAAKDNTREDAVFTYQGNLVVCQSNTTTHVNPSSGRGSKVHTNTVLDQNGEVKLATENQMFIVSGASVAKNTQGQNRKITLQQIMQTGIGTHYGIEIADGENVELTISGAVKLFPIWLPNGSDLKIVGKTQVDDESFNLSDTLFFATNATMDYFLIGNSSKTCGDVTIENLQLKLQTGYLTRGAGDTELTIRKCQMDFSWYAYCIIASSMKQVTFEDCDVEVAFRSDTGSAMFSGCSKILLDNTKFYYRYGGGRHGVTMFSGMGDFEAIDSEISMYVNHSIASTAYYEHLYHTSLAKTINLTNSKLEIDHRAVLNSLVLNGESEVSFSDGKGYLLCPDIEVNDTSKVEADYIVVSGFYYDTGTEAVTEADVYKSLITVGNEVLDGNKTLARLGRVPNGLVLNGGSVTAREFVGGDVNGKITVNGGTLTSKAIGTSGKLYGYAQHVPSEGSAYVYEYEKLPKENAATVTINGGTVQVLDNGYLGGMYTNVTVSGSVELGENAFLGLDKTQEITLSNYYAGIGMIETAYPAFGDLDIVSGTVTGTEADINVPHGNIDITGINSRIQVRDIVAKNGNITITDAVATAENPGFTNGYTYSDSKHTHTAVSVLNMINGQNVYVSDGAVVYALNAYVEVPAGEEGTLCVAKTENEALAYLYIGKGFGASENSKGTFISDNYSVSGNNKNLFGKREVKITYVMGVNALAEDQPVNPTENPRSFSVQSSNEAVEIILLKAERFGYTASDWYMIDENGEKQTVDKVYTGNNIDLTLYVDWTPNNVAFKVEVDPAILTNLDVDAEMAGQEATENEDSGVYTYDKVMEIPYHTENLELSLNLQQYTMNTRKIIAVAIYEDGKVTSVNALTEVSKDLMTTYLEKLKTDSNAAITLKVTSVQQNAHGIWLHLNRANGLPVDAAFPESVLGQIQNSNKGTDAIRAYVDYGQNVLTGVGFDVAGELVKANAAGYNFLGWSGVDANAVPVNLTKDTIASGDLPEHFYAQWDAKEYLVTFDAGMDSTDVSNKVTVSNSDLTEPDEGAAQTITGTVSYDQYLSTVNYEAAIDGILPKAWQVSHKFSGWGYLPKGETDHSKLIPVSSLTRLNLTQIPTMQESLGDLQNTAITLYPIYEAVTVTYHSKDTIWLAPGFAEQGSDSGIYKGSISQRGPLAGYTELAALTSLPADSYELFGVLGENGQAGNIYGVVSTLSDYFTTNNGYVANDYRNDFYKSGYTFKGWTTTEGGTTADIAQTPKYEDLNVWAIWNANTYNLNLYATDNTWQYALSGYKNKDPELNPVTGISVTVGQEINDSNWPSRYVSDDNYWYTYNITDKDVTNPDKRYLLGFTFHSMDPGDTTDGSNGFNTYQVYGTKIELLTNAGSLFINREYGRDDEGNVISGQYTAGSVFKLPGKEYTAVMGAEKEVPDYPAGSTIKMYAAYREISLVFVMYADVDGEVTSHVVHTTDWNKYSNYPFTTFVSEKPDKEITEKGLTLLNWKIHTPLLNAENYTEAYYTANKEKLKEEARKRGTYDIMVYTLYVAQVTKVDETLNASNSPLSSTAPARTEEYPMPASMLTGYLTAKIEENSGLSLIPVSVMQKQAYNSTIKYNGRDYSPDETVAIALSLTSNETTEIIDLADMASFTNQASKGSVVQMTLYHSRVMTKEQSFTLDVKFVFDDNSQPGDANPLENQWVLYDLKINLKPSLYDVYYYADLVDRRAGDIISNNSGFDTTTWQLVRHSVPYGSATLSVVPQVEGYTVDRKWTEADDSFAVLNNGTSINHGANLFFDAQAAANSGKIYLRTDYTVNVHKLSAKEQVLDNWAVQYVNAAGNNDSLGNTDESVEYGKAVTLTLLDGAQKTAPEFIWLSTQVNGTEMLTRLDKIAGNAAVGVYTFLMPDQDVVLKLNDTQVLYLEEGTISINENGYVQEKATGTTTETWSGMYVIWMDSTDNADNSATENTLNLSGNLTDRNIELGNLNISKPDSIAVAEGGNAVLYVDGTIGAENILVPSGASLKMAATSGQSTEQSGLLTLTPNDGSAAIGGNKGEANGNIELEDLAIHMTLVANEYASGIGPGAQNLSNDLGNILVDNCDITVATTTIAEKPSNLAWVGGVNVPSVVLDNTTLQGAAGLQGYDNHLVVSGKTVSLQNGSSLGTNANPILNAVHAENLLTVEDSSIYQKRSKSVYPIAANTIEVENSTIRTSYEGASPDASAENGGLYKGIMKLMDQNADVVICNTLVLDTHHGDIKTQAAGAKQTKSGVTAEHTEGSCYLILNENIVSSETDVVSDITVDIVGVNGEVIFGGSQDVNINDLTVNQDVIVELRKALNVGGTVAIAAQKTLTVDGGSVAITFADTSSFANTDGTYAQNGGSLKIGNPVDCSKLDVKLSNVTAQVADLIVENLTLTNAAVTASGNVGSKGKNSGVTNIVIAGTTTVTAVNIGALGDRDVTFTLIDDSASTLGQNEWWSGTLIRDHYRIKYMNGTVIYKDAGGNALPAVMRTIQTKAEGNVTTVTDKILNPADPEIAAFSAWYFVDSTGVKVALSETAVVGVEKNQEYLTTAEIACATDTTPADGTKTLTLLAWLDVRGNAFVKEGRLFSSFTDVATDVSVQTNGAWTMLVTVKGSAVDGSYYSVSFFKNDGSAYHLPKDTALTLTVPGTNGDRFYGYTVENENTDTISFNQFREMGAGSSAANVAPELPGGESGKEFTESFLLAVDFSGTSMEAVSNVKTALSLHMNSNTVKISEINWSASQLSQGSVSADNGTVTVAYPSDGLLSGELYLVGRVQMNSGGGYADFNMPMDSTVSVNGNGLTSASVSRFGGNKILVDLGTYAASNGGSTQQYSWNVAGLDNGSYKVCWNIAVVPEGCEPNVMNQVLQDTWAEVLMTRNAAETTLEVERNLQSNRIFANTQEHTETFSYHGTLGNVTVKKQNLLADFSGDANVTVLTDNIAKVVTVVFPAGTEAGVYRIMFSLDNDDAEDGDNIYYTFIVE